MAEQEKIDIGKVKDILENLAQTCRDGQEGFRIGGGHAHNTQLKTMLDEISLKRGQAAGDLEAEIERLGEHDLKREGTAKGSMHRAWFELKSKLGAGDDLGVLNWLEQGEDHAKKQFQEALEVKLPSNVREVIERISQDVIASHDKIRDLRDSYKKAA
jgi:uncharacterized protein (TIGR02284 family)